MACRVKAVLGLAVLYLTVGLSLQRRWSRRWPRSSEMAQCRVGPALAEDQA